MRLQDLAREIGVVERATFHGIVTDAMALPHLVYSGLNGYLIRPGDVAELGAHLATLAARLSESSTERRSELT
ncbi:hypothetical protein [Amycolatopsis sp. lyj-112]|uniref:hypothetical protein n=1 Tax=Amycolatopsis sp. lyj-112 TaxID=2789288 RepID=UPI003978F347